MPPEVSLPESQTNGASQPQRPAPQNSTDKLIESTLDFLEHEQADNDRAQRPPKKTPPEPRREPEEEPSEPAAEPSPTGPIPDDEDEGDEDDDENDDEYEAPESDGGRGSKQAPFQVKDLPADKYIALKIDGEKQVIPLSEMAAGYIREQTFNQRVNKIKSLSDQAEAAIKEGRAMQDRTREEFRSFIRDPDQIYDFFMADPERERVFEAAATKYAALLRHFREQPAQRLAFERQRDVERLAQERQRFEAQKQAELAERQNAEMQQRAQAIFRPGWEAGLKKAGFPQPTKELYEEVMVRCNQRARSGQPVTSEDVAEFTLRACRLLELVPASQKPKAAPARPREGRETGASKARRGQDPWADKTRAEKRRDPDYFLRSLRPRDFRL